MNTHPSGSLFGARIASIMMGMKIANLGLAWKMVCAVRQTGSALTGNGSESMTEYVVEMFKENDPQPRVVQELVRCGECAKRNTFECASLRLYEDCEIETGDDWFCAYGERGKA